MATAEELARFHLETAVKLTSKSFVAAWLSSGTAPPPTTTAAVAIPAPAPAAAGHRGRKPGAAPEAERCEWTLVAGDRCKNRRLEAGSFCKIHAGKIHLVDPASTPASTD
jgi:hypothetical protein